MSWDSENIFTECNSLSLFHLFMSFVSISDEFSLENTHLYSTNPCTIGRSRFWIRCEHCSFPFCPGWLLILFIVFSTSCLSRIARKMRVHSQKHEASGIPWFQRAHIHEIDFDFRIYNSLPAHCRGYPRRVPACASRFHATFLKHSPWYSAAIWFWPRVGAEGAFSSSLKRFRTTRSLILDPYSSKVH